MIIDKIHSTILDEAFDALNPKEGLAILEAKRRGGDPFETRGLTREEETMERILRIIR